MDEFEGRVVLITGAVKGLGQEVALAFASLGVRVAANDINPLNVDETVAQIHRLGGDAQGYVSDIAKRMPAEALVAQVVEHFGRLDFLVSHASVDPEAPVLEMDEWDFHRTLDVNLAGPYFCIQLAGRVMREQGGGAMVNILPAGSKTHQGHAAFAASQAGLAGLTRAAAAELAWFNIRLNAICEAPADPEMLTVRVWDAAEIRRWRAAYPTLRLGEQADLVSAVLFLCSEAASSLNGQVLSLEVSQ